MAESEFNLAAYENLLKEFLEIGYQAVSFSAVERQKKHLVLRHDLDMSIPAAIPMAEVERDLGLKATYFVLLRTEMYNPFSAANRTGLFSLMDCGHEIGLHFDASLYEDDPSSMEEAVDMECRVLETLIQRGVPVVGFHRPAKSLQGRQGPIAGRVQTYQTELFNDIGYCSDSRGAWHFGAPLSNIAVQERRAMQLLTHPIWWTQSGTDAIDKLNGYVEEKDFLLRRELALNCEPYRKVFDPSTQ